MLHELHVISLTALILKEWVTLLHWSSASWGRHIQPPPVPQLPPWCCYSDATSVLRYLDILLAHGAPESSCLWISTKSKSIKPYLEPFGSLPIARSLMMGPELAEVDSIRRFGGSTSPEMPWPEDERLLTDDETWWSLRLLDPVGLSMAQSFMLIGWSCITNPEE